ncbi:3-oxoacyl-reductase [Lentinula aff. detonsa]|nr:3-oxoacyl-reductase [Lentinula aff. detonsa]
MAPTPFWMNSVFMLPRWTRSVRNTATHLRSFTTTRHRAQSDSRSAIVTGAGRGIGRAIALRLAQDGFDICVNDLDNNIEDVNNVVKEIHLLGRSSVAFCGDVSSMTSVQEMIAASVAGLGPLNVMVANAGIAQVGWPMEIKEAEMRRMFEVNVFGVVNSSIAAAQQFIKQGTKGKILNAASGVSFRTDPLLPMYSASKAAVRSITQSFAIELGKHGITVNGYAPGIVQSAMWEHIDSELGKINGLPQGENFNAFTKSIALRRTSIPEDAAKLVSYLAGPDSDYVTGQTILVDGGLVFN